MTRGRDGMNPPLATANDAEMRGEQMKGKRGESQSAARHGNLAGRPALNPAGQGGSRARLLLQWVAAPVLPLQ